MRTLFTILCALSLGIACQQPTAEESNTKSYHKNGDTLTLVNNSPLSEKIKTSTIAEEIYIKELSTAALVKAIPTQFAHIAPPFSGRVVKSHMHLGQKVAKNDPLFELISPEFLQAQKEYFQAKSTCLLTLQTLNRQKDLIKNGVGTKKELEEAQNALEIALQEYRNQSEAIKIYHINPEAMKLGQHLVVRSPLAGEILENNLIVGQFLKEDTEEIATVANLSRIWIAAQVKEKDIRHIHKNDEVEIKAGAYPDMRFTGKIFHIQEIMNEDTRSIEVLIESENPSSILKHGMYVTVKFKSQATKKIILPDQAVLQGEESAYVYIQDSKNVYIKRKIKTEGTQNGKIVVQSGLNADEIIVSEGGYYLLHTR